MFAQRVARLRARTDALACATGQLLRLFQGPLLSQRERGWWTQEKWHASVWYLTGHAMHAGREIRVIVKPEHVDDDSAALLSREILATL